MVEGAHGVVGKGRVGAVGKGAVQLRGVTCQVGHFGGFDALIGLVQIGVIVGLAEVFYCQNTVFCVRTDELRHKRTQLRNGLDFSVKITLNHCPLSGGGYAGVFFDVSAGLLYNKRPPRRSLNPQGVVHIALTRLGGRHQCFLVSKPVLAFEVALQFGCVVRI